MRRVATTGHDTRHDTRRRTLLDAALLLGREEGRGPGPPGELVELRFLHVRDELPLEGPHAEACGGGGGVSKGVVGWGVVSRVESSRVEWSGVGGWAVGRLVGWLVGWLVGGGTGSKGGVGSTTLNTNTHTSRSTAIRQSVPRPFPILRARPRPKNTLTVVVRVLVVGVAHGLLDGVHQVAARGVPPQVVHAGDVLPGGVFGG